MRPLEVGTAAPRAPGVEFGDGPVGLFFYKVTCPVCQMAAPKMSAFESAMPGRVVGVGQDPGEALEDFRATYRMDIRSISDAPPYPVSDAYGVVAVPTFFLVSADGTIEAVVESWDREGLNDAARRMAKDLGLEAPIVSDASDGLPAFRPG